MILYIGHNKHISLLFLIFLILFLSLFSPLSLSLFLSFPPPRLPFCSHIQPCSLTALCSNKRSIVHILHGKHGLLHFRLLNANRYIHRIGQLIQFHLDLFFTLYSILCVCCFILSRMLFALSLMASYLNVVVVRRQCFCCCCCFFLEQVTVVMRVQNESIVHTHTHTYTY